MNLQDNYFTNIRIALSNERFNAYGTRPDMADKDRLARYLWNAALSEALYTALQCLEITLRNRINQAFTTFFQDQFWFDQPELRLEKWVFQARESLNKQRKPLESGRIVAELSFGFWTALMDSRYEHMLWRGGLLKEVFPDMPRWVRKRKTISERFNKIRRLRNRIFHYEPIWYWKDLPEQYEQLVEALGWMSPAMMETLKMTSRFPITYQQGIPYYVSKLDLVITGLLIENK